MKSKKVYNELIIIKIITTKTFMHRFTWLEGGGVACLLISYKKNIVPRRGLHKCTM